jgi:2-keto-4-pentenoate hydratase/2-oxohepta-3-ene-1,7-dioic acid hydratase in catechol pathway
MRLCMFGATSKKAAPPRFGVVEGAKVYPVGEHASLAEILAQGIGPKSLRRSGEWFGIDTVRVFPPLSRPGKIVAAIVNTRGMLGGDDVALDRPRLDMKAPSTVVGTGDTVRGPKSGVRPEVELAAVVGRRISKSTIKEAKEGVFGYTILNDVTAPKDSKDDAYEAYRRDKKTGVIGKTALRGPLFRSKNHDTFCPLGPWVVTADELGDTSDLRMTTKFNGSLVQDGSTAEYIFTPEEVAAYVSGFLTLEPGDIVSCGSVGWTTEAVGDLDPTEYVLPSKTGVLELEVQGVGVLRNPVVTE